MTPEALQDFVTARASCLLLPNEVYVPPSSDFLKAYKEAVPLAKRFIVDNIMLSYNIFEEAGGMCAVLSVLKTEFSNFDADKNWYCGFLDVSVGKIAWYNNGDPVADEREKAKCYFNTVFNAVPEHIRNVQTLFLRDKYLFLTRKP